MTFVMLITIRSPECGGPGLRRLNCKNADNLDRDTFDFGGFYAETKRLMPQLAPKRIFYTGVTNLFKRPIV
jgi:hypothetical protein